MPKRKSAQTKRQEEVAAAHNRWRINELKAGKEARKITAGEQLREERLKKDENERAPIDRPTWRLKQGSGQMEVGWARFWEEELRDLLEKHPEHFQAIHALVKGRSKGISETLLRDLKKWGYILRDGSALPDVKAVMMAAVRETPDGLCLVDPLDVRTPIDAANLRQFDEQREERYKKGVERLYRLLREEGRDEDKDRSR